MCNTKQNEANIKNTSKMALRVCNMINQEGNKSSTPKLQGINEKYRYYQKNSKGIVEGT